MSWMGTADLAQMRSDVANLLPDTCVIQAAQWVSDGAGGGSIQLTASGTVACRVDPVSARERDELLARWEALEEAYILTVPHDTSVTDDNYMLINGVSYNILSIDDKHSRNVAVRVRIGRVT